MPMYFRHKITEHVVLNLYDDIMRQLKTTTFSIFIDLSKAFNTIDRNILLKKLKHYGIRSNSPELFKDYSSLFLITLTQKYLI